MGPEDSCRGHIFKHFLQTSFTSAALNKTRTNVSSIENGTYLEYVCSFCVLEFSSLEEIIYKNMSHYEKHLAAVKSTIFWDITMCSPLKVDRRFGGACRFHLQGRRISGALLSTFFQAGFLLGVFFEPEDGGDMFLRNDGWLSRDYTVLYPRREYAS
jgi:hypothetical protein